MWCPIGGFRGWGGHGVPSGRSDPDLDERWHRVCDQESLTGANDILFFDRQLEFLPTSKAQTEAADRHGKMARNRVRGMGRFATKGPARVTTMEPAQETLGSVGGSVTIVIIDDDDDQTTKPTVDKHQAVPEAVVSRAPRRAATVAATKKVKKQASASSEEEEEEEEVELTDLDSDDDSGA